MQQEPDDRARPGSRRLGWAPAVAAVLTFAVVAAVVTTTLRARDGGPGPAADDGPALHLVAQVVQLRRDEVFGRVEIALTNRGTEQVQVERLRLRVGGFTGGGWVAKDSPVPPGQLVDLPTPYGEPRCPSGGLATPGRLRLTVQVHTDTDPTVRRVALRPRASRPLMTRILRGLCTARRLSGEVALSFGPTWRSEGSGDATRLHTTLDARLAAGAPPRDVTQVAGTVLFDFAVESGTPPYARLDGSHPTASIPVVVSQARCTGHAKGETKQPYNFLVWLGDPGTDGIAVVLPVSDADKVRLRAVCAF